jgi:hypothetical protein
VGASFGTPSLTTFEKGNFVRSKCTSLDIGKKEKRFYGIRICLNVHTNRRVKKNLSKNKELQKMNKKSNKILTSQTTCRRERFSCKLLSIIFVLRVIGRTRIAFWTCAIFTLALYTGRASYRLKLRTPMFYLKFTRGCSI